MSFDLSSIEELLMHLHPNKPVWLKFSPYSDPMFLKEMAAVVNSAKSKVKAVVTCNTFPNAYVSRNAITPNDGLADLSGPALKSIALGQVVQWRKHLDSDIDVIGVGGITTGNDAQDFLEAGASAIQTNSLAFWSGKPPEYGGRLTAEGSSERFTI